MQGTGKTTTKAFKVALQEAGWIVPKEYQRYFNKDLKRKVDYYYKKCVYASEYTSDIIIYYQELCKAQKEFYDDTMDRLKAGNN